MNQSAITFNATPNPFRQNDVSTSCNTTVSASKLRSAARLTGLFLFVIISLFSFFALQISALELSDRFGIFPLYGFFFFNLVCAAVLSLLFYISKKYAYLLNQDSVQNSFPYANFPSFIWTKLTNAFSFSKPKLNTKANPKPIAVLMIIKRQSKVESETKSRAASA